MNILLATLRYFSAHAAAIGGSVGALILLLSGHPTEAFAAFIAALAGFGLPIKPAAQLELEASCR